MHDVGGLGRGQEGNHRAGGVEAQVAVVRDDVHGGVPAAMRRPRPHVVARRDVDAVETDTRAPREHGAPVAAVLVHDRILGWYHPLWRGAVTVTVTVAIEKRAVDELAPVDLAPPVPEHPPECRAADVAPDGLLSRDEKGECLAHLSAARERGDVRDGESAENVQEELRREGRQWGEDGLLDFSPGVLELGRERGQDGEMGEGGDKLGDPLGRCGGQDGLGGMVCGVRRCRGDGWVGWGAGGRSRKVFLLVLGVDLCVHLGGGGCIST